jgi:hypothetical protein
MEKIAEKLGEYLYFRIPYFPTIEPPTRMA